MHTRENPVAHRGIVASYLDIDMSRTSKYIWTLALPYRNKIPHNKYRQFKSMGVPFTRLNHRTELEAMSVAKRPREILSCNSCRKRRLKCDKVTRRLHSSIISHAPNQSRSIRHADDVQAHGFCAAMVEHRENRTNKVIKEGPVDLSLKIVMRRPDQQG